MTPPELLASLRSRGVTFAVEWGQLLVSPRSLLTAEDVEAIKANRDALIVLVDPSLAPRDSVIGNPITDDWDAVTDAIVDRAWREEPEWEHVPPRGWGLCVRESVIVRLEGFPPVALSPAEAAALEAVIERSRRLRAKRVEVEKVKPAATHCPPPSMFTTPEARP